MILTATVLEIARQHIGDREYKDRANSGPEVDLFLASVGLLPGFAWCSAFMFWLFKSAAAQTGLVNPYPKTASSLHVWTLAEPICRASNPSVGAVYVLRHSATTGHIGIVESIDDGVIKEISGNTNEKGSRSGDSVRRHVGQPEVTHGGELLGYLQFDLAAQHPSVVS